MTDRRTRRAQDLILAAAVRPEGWKDVLHYLAKVTDCVAGGITIEDAHTRKGEPLVYFGFDPNHVRRTFDYYLPMNPLFGIAERMKPGFVVTNGDVIDEGAFRRTEFYNGWARPQGLCCPTTVVLNRKSDRYCPLTLVRPIGKGDVSRSDLRWLRRLVPHLVRAMEITVELDRRSLDYHLVDVATEDSNLGLIALDEEGRIVYSNSVAETRLRRELGIKQRQGKLWGVTPHVDGQLKQAVSLAYASKTLGRDVRIEAEGRPALVVKIIPLVSEYGFAKIIPRRPAALLVFRDAPLDIDRRLQSIGEVLDARTIERARMAQALDALRCAVVLTDAGGTILHANVAAEDMLRNGTPILRVGGVLTTSAPAAAAKLRAAITHAANDETNIGKIGLPISLTGPGEQPATAHILPLTGSELRTRLQPVAVAGVFIGAPPHVQDAADTVAVAFGLTPAETRVLASLLAGRTLAETAATLDIAATTAKSHLENIFTKTGVTRQADLMRLATGLVPPTRSKRCRP